MININSVNIPFRIVKKEDGFQIFNTKTFDTILLDELSMGILKKIKNKDITTDEELKLYAENNNIETEDCMGLIKFLSKNEYITIE